MSHQSSLIESDILKYLNHQEHKSLLRFITCGSVDDGKSTLIGRLLYESKLIYDDQLAALETDSKKMGTQGQDIDFALLVDGLASEREQGITIDVAYRFFSTDKRKFIVADTPGHEQYTRNMATGASTADLAILMVDARHGIQTQTRRHSTIVHMLGVGHMVLAINKMDLVGYSEERYQTIVDDYHSFASSIGISNITAIPMSALKGDNITTQSHDMSWYTGQPLIKFLETVPLKPVKDSAAFTMPVQWVNRPHLDFRGFAGQITTGTVSVGDTIQVLPKKVTSTVKSIITFENELTTAIRGQSVTLTLTDEIDVSRGDVLVPSESTVQVGSRFLSTLLWMSEDAMVPGKSYWVKTRAKLCSAIISTPKHQLNVNTLEKVPASALVLNEIGDCVCEFDQDIPVAPYSENPHLGSFIIIDRESNNTVGMGLIQSVLKNDGWVTRHVAQREKCWQHGLVNRQQRIERHGHAPLLVLLTGSVSKERVFECATQLEKSIFDAGINVYRHGAQFLRMVGDDMDGLRLDMFRQVSDMAHAFLDAGMVFVTSIHALTQDEMLDIRRMVAPFDVMVIDLNGDDSLADAVWPNTDDAIDHVQAQILAAINR